MPQSGVRQLRRIATAALRKSSEYGGESAGGGALESADTVSRDVVDASVALLDEKLVKSAGGRGKLTDEDQQLIESSREATKKLMDDGADAILSPFEEMALEAIAIADGSRPALLIKNDAIDPSDKLAGEWADELKMYEPIIRDIAPRVGRINIDGQHVGTGWMIRPGYVVTNRHVAQDLSGDQKPAQLKLDPLRVPTICFGHEADEAAPRPQYTIKEIVFCGDKFIDPTMSDFSLLDMAVLRLDEADKDKLPPPLPTTYVASADIKAGRQLYVLGYPGPASRSLLPQQTLLSLLGSHKSVKRFSPGEIVAPLGGINGDTPKRTIAHDATTLGGSSGSAILGFDETGQPKLIGLHFGGYEVRYGPGGVEEYRGRNFAHCFAAMNDVMNTVDTVIAEGKTGV